ncbi:TPA: hypothetical protein I7264_07370 [Vibrio parahaemolyticus]|uniref:hypothetical protein n=1 Tax=Vibrio TaxID=662 RepID=UPI0009846D3A|nr:MULTISPECIES: hypothetical protein [Vibrio]EGQ8061351.1 hypothetical protein [Vibrio parahaemolyticus]EHH1247236.1 hypothetical protein [Vibrio parahaemolyticus]EHK0842054.1 hypothetical protein [Vibrio parahaemolyticus]EHR5480041.1 hypothetical protein [Vibrio parahaemolyticus]EII3138135.1 hypothetical protein [Vibrio parahaemolyticus]
MNWSEKDFWNENYFNDITSSLESGSFINFEIDYHPIFQVGVWVVERVDLVIREVGDFEEYVPLTRAAILALEAAFKTYPEFVSYHIQHSIGALTYAGILDANNNDVREFWRYVYKFSDSKSWVNRLAIHTLSDDDFYEKVREVYLYSEQGLNDYEIFKRIEQDSFLLERTITSADSLVELGIISDSPCA